MTRKVFTLTLEPVATCNLGCAYCYAAKGGAAGPDVAFFESALEGFSQAVAQAGFDALDCVWLGGEPLLAGRAFYERMAAWTDKAARRMPIRHFMQTNGLLLDDAYCRLLRDAGINLGLSLDGPRDIHDAFRRTPDGGPTFDRVMAAVELLRRHEVPFGCVAVVTSRTLGRERDVYDFFCDLGCGLRINPVIPGPPSADDLAGIRPEAYGDSLVRFFDAWNEARGDRVPVSPLDNYVVSLLGGALRECQQRPSCAGEGLGLKPSGDVVRCGRFQDLVLGNLARVSPRELVAGRQPDPFRGRAEALTSCHGCEFWPQCHGGCPHNAVAFGRGPLAKDPFCAAYKKLFSHIKKALSL